MKEDRLEGTVREKGQMLLARLSATTLLGAEMVPRMKETYFGATADLVLNATDCSGTNASTHGHDLLDTSSQSFDGLDCTKG